MRVYNLARSIHLTNYPTIARLRVIWAEAIKWGLKVTVCPSVWPKLSRIWRERLRTDYLFKPGLIKRDLMFNIKQGHNLVTVQQVLFQKWGLKLTIQTLKRWLMQEYAKYRSLAWPLVQWR